jgi:hypothetical protein
VIRDSEFLHSLSEEGGAPEQGFDQRHAEIGTQDSKWDAGQASATAYVGYRSIGGDQAAQGSTIQNVAIP